MGYLGFAKEEQVSSHPIQRLLGIPAQVVRSDTLTLLKIYVSAT